MNQEINQKINKIISIYKTLSSIKSFIPSPVINNAFSSLVDVINSTDEYLSKEILQDENIINLITDFQRISSQGESELEYFWVEKILANGNLDKEIIEFPYYDNYIKLAQLEAEAIRDCNIDHQHRILFVGSGPLPLSSIILNEKYGLDIDNLDYDKRACELSSSLIDHFEFSKNTRVIHKDILNITDFSAYDYIIIAALVGENKVEKIRVIEHIVQHAQKGTHLAIRSVTGLGNLLYPALSKSDLNMIDVADIYNPPKGVINNLIIGTIK